MQDRFLMHNSCRIVDFFLFCFFFPFSGASLLAFLLNCLSCLISLSLSLSLSLARARARARAQICMVGSRGNEMTNIFLRDRIITVTNHSNNLFSVLESVVWFLFFT